MVKGSRAIRRVMVPAAFLAAGIFFPSARAESPDPTVSRAPARAAVPAAGSAKTPGLAARPKAAVASYATPRYQPDRFAGRARSYYRLIWGVDSLAVRWAESGEVIKFTYRVLDAERAQVLNDKRAEPSLIDPQAGVSLVVPSLENVGQLRQSVPPENGKSYWMVFSNKGRLVKRGDHVNIVIGSFHANGLIVD
jgi:hypothetical protein